MGVFRWLKPAYYLTDLPSDLPFDGCLAVGGIDGVGEGEFLR
ncbi:MAG: hypothetical protein AAF703_00215 [Cyanobacteria bacterium P01_D01_bin.105]